MINEDFWVRVKALIKAHNMSQMQFADHCGFSRNTFRGWIYHKRIPEMSSAFVIAHALGVTLDYLFAGKDKSIIEFRLKQIELRKSVGRISVDIDRIKKEIIQIRPL